MPASHSMRKRLPQVRQPPGDRQRILRVPAIGRRTRPEAKPKGLRSAQELVKAEPDSFRRDLDGTLAGHLRLCEAPDSGPAPAPALTPAVAPVPARPLHDGSSGSDCSCPNDDKRCRRGRCAGEGLAGTAARAAQERLAAQQSQRRRQNSERKRACRNSSRPIQTAAGAIPPASRRDSSRARKRSKPSLAEVDSSRTTRIFPHQS